MKSKTRKKKGCFWVAIILLIAAVAGVVIWLNMDRIILVPDRSQVAPDYFASKTRVNILVLGADSGEAGYTGRSDSMMVFSLDLKNKKVSALSIPRDTRVEIPGESNKSKINHAFYVGGIDLAKQTVENLLKVPIDYYAITDFEGFKDIIDALGGIEVNVDKRMYYHTDYDDIDLQPGLQTLGGKDALDYVRYRHDALGDITRAGRQQVFMKAVMDKMLEPQNVAKLPTLLPKVMAAVKTDLSTSKLILLAKDFSGIDTTTSVRTETLPGTFANHGGVSYWEVDEDKLSELVPMLFEDQTATTTGTETGTEAGKETGAETDAAPSE